MHTYIHLYVKYIEICPCDLVQKARKFGIPQSDFKNFTHPSGLALLVVEFGNMESVFYILSLHQIYFFNRLI